LPSQDRAQKKKRENLRKPSEPDVAGSNPAGPANSFK